MFVVHNSDLIEAQYHPRNMNEQIQFRVTLQQAWISIYKLKMLLFINYM